MPKSPFEKIRSLVERRKLFQEVLNLKEQIVCKGADDSLFQFIPYALVGDTLLNGYLTAIEGLPQKDTTILGNFSVGTDKYFFNADLKVMHGEAVFHTQCEVFRLQRRSSLRLQIQPAFGIYLAITEVQGKLNYALAQIADVSTGGARIFFSEVDSPVPASSNSKDPGLKPGDRLKAVLHNGPKKSIEVQGIVRHSQKSVYRDQIVEQFGIEFVDLVPLTKNRLISMSMELQQKMAWEDY